MELKRYKSSLLFVALCLAAASLHASDSHLTVLASGNTEFRFIYNFEPGLANLPLTADSNTLASLAAVVQIALPPGADARLISATGRRERADSYATAANQLSGPSSIAEVSRPITMRGRTTVGVKVSPFDGGVAYNEVEVHIGFDRTRSTANLSAPNDPVFDRIWAASLANYDVARTWPVIDDRSSALSAAALDSYLTPGRWYRVVVANTGLIRVTGAQLESAGIGLGNLNSDSIHIFNAGGLPNSVDNTDPRPQFEQISLLVQDGGDGLFNRGDQLFFYGEAPSRWVYQSGEFPKFMNNRYTKENVYWLKVSGSPDGVPNRMQQISGVPSGPPVPLIDSYRNWVRAEEDNIISIEADGHVWDFYNWYWTDETSLAAFVPTPGAIETDSAYIYTAVRSRTNRDVVLTVNGSTAILSNWQSSACQHYSYSLLGGANDVNRIDLQLSPISAQIPPFLDYLDLSYHRQILPVNNRIDFNLENVDGEVEIRVIDNFTTTPIVFDISDPLHPVIIAGYNRSGGYLTFRATTVLDGPNRFLCDVIGQALSPARIESTDVTDLRTGFSQADMLIVTTPSLASGLDEYVAYRAGEGVTSQIILLDDIIDNFSYGLYDPTAIRDFLKFAYESYPAPAPATALFVGDANYDFHDHLGTGQPNYVPSFIRSGDRTYSDDNYVYFGDFGILDIDRDRASDMMTARWPAKSVSEINVIMDKIRTYEAASNHGVWRTRITLVADDEHTREKHNETFHTTDTEILEKSYIPRLLNRNKIYLWDYPFVNLEKPDVNDAIVDAFNDGSLIINYVGHGNPDVWSHEHVFQRTGDLPRLHNADRLPLVYAASCDIGFFDDPVREGMAEDLLAMPSAGAIGVISATRLVYAADNAQFNRVVYDNLFADPNLSICEAMFAAKIERQYPNPLDTIPRPVDNDRAYVFLGDPWLKLGLPRLRLEFSEKPDSLVALGISRLSGRVVDESGLPYNADGLLNVTVYDSERKHSYRLPGDTNSIDYYVAGPTIFRGTAGINDGYFSLQFVTPLDVGYRGASARVSAYAVLGGMDGVGLVDSIAVSETLNPIEDQDGPVIAYTVPGRGNLIDGSLLSRDESLQITLLDPSGINLAAGVGHGISLILDDRIEESINLTELFQYDQDNYTGGSLVFPLADLNPGPHRFMIKAWDNVNNVTAVEFAAEIAADDRLVVRDLLNYPNPMNDITTFYFELSRPVDELAVGIYTLSGKNIWNSDRYQLGADNYPNGSDEIVWNGRDADGDRVAAGVYVYRLTARAATGGETVEEFGKIVVLN